MSIIIQSERKTTWARMVVLGCYILLIIGGATMVFPFLWMASGSFKGKVDAHDYDLIPEFLHNDEVLFKRYLEEKYSERIQDYQIATGDYAPRFKLVDPPVLPTNQLISDWEAFCDIETEPTRFQLGSLAYSVGAKQKIIPKNLREFRLYIKDLCNNDLEVFHERFSSKLVSWFYLETKAERLLDRNYTLTPNHNLTEALNDFKVSRHYSDRIYLSVNGDYRNKCKADDRFKHDIKEFNRLNNTQYRSFGEINIPRTIPETPERFVWEKYVRKALHSQFIYIEPEAKPLYTEFLKGKYREIGNLNKLYKTSYQAFEEVPFPEKKVYSTPDVIDYIAFLEDPNLLPVEYIYLDTPEMHWQTFLRQRYEDVASVSKAHQQSYASFDAIPLPHKTMDYAYVLNQSTELRWHYTVRNYQMVFDYVSIYGRGIMNTIIYCALAILAALTVNPLAAYALSRYNLTSQYKILLFFIATIAFPGMVTMIPSYLLLQDLGLLNTFAALVLPGLANGYSIFLLKGFFDSLPRELYEAADIDGASEFFKFWNITLNLSKPILAVIALGAFTAAYGNFMYAFVLCQDSDMWTLMVWLFQLQYHATQGVQFASLLIAAIPTLVVFIFAQRIIIQGIVVPVEK